MFYRLTRTKYHLIFVVAAILFYINSVQAASSDIVVSTPTNSPLTINLSFSLSHLTNPVLSLSGTGESGTASVVACNSGDMLCVSYSPSSGFAGVDTLLYNVISDAADPVTGSISITVGDVNNTNAGTSPDIVVEETLTNICLLQEDSNIVDLCESFSAATNSSDLDDLRELLKAITPQDIAAFGTITNDMASQQLANIGKRLGAFRNMQTKSLSFDYTPAVIRDSYKYSTYRNNNSLEEDPFDNTSWFVSVQGGTGKQTETSLEDGYRYDSYGLTVGVDKRVGSRMIFGVAAGTSLVKSKVENAGGNLDVSGKNLILYNSLYLKGNMFLDAAFSLHSNSFDMSRHVLFGTTDAYAKSESSGSSQNISVGLGYDHNYAKGITTSINLKWHYQRSEIGAITEEGADPYNLYIDKRVLSQSQINLGIQNSAAFSFPWGVVLPQLNIDVFYTAGNSADDIEGYFVVDQSQNKFRFAINPLDELYYKVGIGSSFILTGGKMGFLHFSQTIGRENLFYWHISAGGRFEF